MSLVQTLRKPILAFTSILSRFLSLVLPRVTLLVLSTGWWSAASCWWRGSGSSRWMKELNRNINDLCCIQEVPAPRVVYIWLHVVSMKWHTVGVKVRLNGQVNPWNLTFIRWIKPKLGFSSGQNEGRYIYYYHAPYSC